MWSLCLYTIGIIFWAVFTITFFIRITIECFIGFLFLAAKAYDIGTRIFGKNPKNGLGPFYT